MVNRPWHKLTWSKAPDDLGFRSRCGFKILKMAPSMLPIKFWLNPTYGLGGNVIWKIYGAILNIGMEQFKQFWISILLPCLPSSFGSIQLRVWENMPPIKFWLHPTYSLGGDVVWRIFLDIRTEQFWQFWISMLLPCLTSSFRSIGLGEDAVQRISRWPSSWWPSWISKQNDSSNSESLCHCDAFHQVSAQSNLGLGQDVIWRIIRWSQWRPSCI